MKLNLRSIHSINRPGGHGRITHLHMNESGVVISADIKYTLGGSDTKVGITLVTPYQELPPRGRSRRGVSLAEGAQVVENSKADKENKQKGGKQRSSIGPSKSKEVLSSRARSRRQGSVEIARVDISKADKENRQNEGSRPSCKDQSKKKVRELPSRSRSKQKEVAEAGTSKTDQRNEGTRESCKYPSTKKVTEMPSRTQSKQKEVVEVDCSNTDKENKPSVGTRRSSREPSKKKVAETSKRADSKRAACFQVSRPKKKSAKRTEKRGSVGPTQALLNDASKTKDLLDGVPREITCDDDEPSFLSPLNTFSKMDSMLNVQRSPVERVYDGDSLGSVGENNIHYGMKRSDNGVVTQSPVSRSKQLFSGEVNREGLIVFSTEESSSLSRHRTTLERVQQAQLDVATKFVNEVVQHTHEQQPLREPEPEENERETLFVACLYHVVQMVDDGFVAENDLIDLVNAASLERQNTISPFQQDEVLVYIDSLLSSGRFMRSDGLIIVI